MRVVRWFIILSALVWLIFELYQIISGKPTISEGLWEMSDRATSISFACGMLMAHFFWSRR